MNIKILCVGKIKSKEINALIVENLKRIKKFKIQVIEVRSAGDDVKKEQDNILKKISEINSSAKSILLTEWGQEQTSKDLAKQVQSFYEAGQEVVFIIGGASGFEKSFIQNFDHTLALSNMTYPHEFARLLLVEQIYRAQAIMDGHPYHK